MNTMGKKILGFRLLWAVSQSFIDPYEVFSDVQKKKGVRHLKTCLLLIKPFSLIKCIIPN